MINLFILIPSLPSRRKFFQQRLLDSIESQIALEERVDIEVICLYDNKKRTIGEKRNNLLDITKGRFLVFLDDDDLVSDSYIKRVMGVIDNNPEVDCIVYDCLFTEDGKKNMLCKYGVELDYNFAIPGSGVIWTGKPAHTMVYASSIAKKHKFPLQQEKEDIAWVKRVCCEVKNQARIDETLYYYQWVPSKTEAKGFIIS